jgi:hypothetical protein
MLDERLPENLDDFLHRLEQSGATNPTTDEQEAAPGGPTRLIDIHVYDLAPGDPAPSVEGSLAEASPDQQDAPETGHEGEATTPLPPASSSPTPPLHLPIPAVVGIGITILLLMGACLWYGLPLLAPTATVTLIPVSRTITTTGTLTVLTGPANTATEQIPGRQLSTITMSQAARVPTTGTGHQDAQAAHGTISLYNAAPYEQTIAAGTMLTGADGVQVVTDTAAVIPAAIPPTEGQVSVSAHAALAGPGGNIAAHDIYGPCCRLNVFAANSAFTGGQVARSYPMVTAHDISAAASTLEKSLTRSMQAAFQSQVKSDETLITPLPCTPMVNPDHQAGTEARTVQVTVSLICTGEVYRTSAYQAAITQMVRHAAMQQLGAGYAQSGAIQAGITATTYRPHGAVSLAIKGAGTWTYQISQSERAAVPGLIAGKSKQEATSILLALPGVQSAAISQERGNTLPAMMNRIQVIVVSYTD